MNKNNPKIVPTESTRDALIRRAEICFTRAGYANISIDEIVKQEQLTKGAVYYYFKDKKTLFEQVVDRLLEEMVYDITRVIATKASPWDRTMTALESYLEGCLKPSYLRIILQEAPVILGWEAWREKEKKSVMGLTTMLLQELMESGTIKKQSIHMLSYILFGAITEAAIGIADADNTIEARKQAKDILEQLLYSLKA